MFVFHFARLYGIMLEFVERILGIVHVRAVV